MADAIIQIPPDSTGKMIDETSLTVGANLVHRQRVQIAGGADVDLATVTGGRLDVNSTPGLTDAELRAASVPVVEDNSAAILAALTVGGNIVPDALDTIATQITDLTALTTADIFPLLGVMDARLAAIEANMATLAGAIVPAAPLSGLPAIRTTPDV